MNIDELRDRLDYEEACRQNLDPDYKDELKGAIAVLAVIITVSLLVFLLGAAGIRRTRTEKVDMIEFNTCYKDIEMKEIAYRQVIAYEWSPDYSRFHVIEFRMIPDNNERPVNKYNKRYEFRAKEGLVVSDVFNETHTYMLNDPERANRKVFSQKYRRGLFNKW